MRTPRILIVQFGCQYTDVIERSLREIGFRAAILPPGKAEAYIRTENPRAIILSGGLDSVNREGSPAIESWVLDAGIPILGICYGMQLIAKMRGGSVETRNGEYGPSTAALSRSKLFAGLPESVVVLASHGDTVEKLPDGFERIAEASDGAIAAMEHRERRIWGVQFHPEVPDTPLGRMILENFVGSIAGCEKDWRPTDIISEIRFGLQSKVSDGSALILFSGGVDSTTLTAIAGPVLGARLSAVCIDGGQLREGELAEIIRNAECAGVDLRVCDAEKQFMQCWESQPDDTYDAELKRKIFSNQYQLCAADYVKRGITHLLQGTLGPDMIESGRTGGAIIKTHHNANIEVANCTVLHPLAKLFKPEVRALARALELPESISQRKPSPGPGLYVRIVGWPNREKRDVVRWADRRVADLAGEFKVDKDFSQLVVGMAGGRYVGVKGSARAYGYGLIVRAVETVDFMTARGHQFPREFRSIVTSELGKHEKVTRIFWDETSKPPATVELE